VGHPAYLVSYLYASYCDMFRVPHHIRRCLWGGLKGNTTYTSKDCTDYEGIDANDQPDFQLCPITKIESVW